MFEAWFNHDGWCNVNQSNFENEITLIDEEPEAFRNLLLFVYTDEVEVNANNVLDTLYTAKKYCITYLEKACINYLEKCLNPESAFFLLTKVGLLFCVFNEFLTENCLQITNALILI